MVIVVFLLVLLFVDIVKLSRTSRQVHFSNTDIRSLSDDYHRSTHTSRTIGAKLTLESEITKNVDGNTDIRGDEQLVVEWHKGVESFEEDQDGGEGEGEVGKVWLQGLSGISTESPDEQCDTDRFVGQGVSRDTLSLHSSHETDMTGQDGDPGQTTEPGSEHPSSALRLTL